MTAPLTSQPDFGVQRAAANSTVYHCLTPDAAQALFVGNGRVGVAVTVLPDRVRLTISRTDLWNEQGRMGAIAALELRPPAPRVPQGTIRQRCALDRAEIQIDAADGSTGQFRLCLTVPRQADAVVVEMSAQPGAGWQVRVEDWHAEAQTQSEEGTLAIAHVNAASPFATINARVGVADAGVDPILGRAWAMVLRSGGMAMGDGWIELPTETQPLVVGVVCIEPEAGDTRARAIELATSIATASGEQIDRWLRDHHDWWRNFWQRSFIRLDSATGDAEYEERLWYTALFHIACGSGGRYPMRFNGGPFLLDRDERFWDNGYWFQNMRELYWPLYAAGHYDLIRPFFQWYFDNAGFVRRQTRAVFGVDDALSFRETQLCWGASPDINLLDGQSNPSTHWHLCQNLELCLLMDWYVRATGDSSFEREVYYPLFRQIVTFYRAIMKPDAAGVRHLGPVNAIEAYHDVIDPMPDIAGLHVMLPKLVAMCERLGEPCELWRKMLAALPPIPVGRSTIASTFQAGIHRQEELTAIELCEDGHLLPCGQLSQQRHSRCNMENPELYAVFPWGLIGLDSPDPLRRRAELTWQHRTWKHVNNGWAQDVPQLARLGEAERARQRSMEHASLSQRFPNGAFISPAGAHFHGLLTSTAYFDSAGVHAAGINEMLLQSHDGIIRIAPTVSGEWSGAFRLHTLDGFVVEAEFVRGRAMRAEIRATRDTVMTVRNARQVEAEISGDASRQTLAAGQDFSAAMTAGQVCRIVWRDAAPLPDEPPRPDVLWPGFRVRPPLTARASGHWHDERDGHGQVGLLRDGLYPATR